MKKKTILSLKTNNSFATVDDLIYSFQQRYPKKYFYKPIGIEVEVTNVCNLKCRGCSLIIDEIDKPKDILKDEEFITVLKECKKLGMFGYSLTGGETFLQFDRVKKILSADHGLDIYKINTNGSFFKTPSMTTNYLLQLKEAGFGTKNKYIKPVLVVSLGHQNLAGVPLQNAVNVVALFYIIFNREDVVFSFNITEKNQLLAQKIFADFKKLYFKITQQEFDESIFEVRFFSLNNIPTLKRLNVFLGPKVPIAELLEDYKKNYLSGGCFNLRVHNAHREDEAETLIPRCVLRPNGDVYACPGFNRVHRIGNILDNNIGKIIEDTNKDKLLRIVFTKNLQGLFSFAIKSNPKLHELRLEKSYGPCDLCQVLTSVIRQKPIKPYKFSYE